MRQESAAIAEFYDSPAGRAAGAMLRARVEALWPSLAGESVLAIGHARPVLEGLGAEATRLVLVETGSGAAESWDGRGRGNVTLRADEMRLPFGAGQFSRVILMHGLEEADAPTLLLREVWRVCAPEGRLLVVAANRAGLWSRAEATPFGHGRPFTRRQLRALLLDAMFLPTASAHALYWPPLEWRVVTGAAGAWERAGEMLWPALGGAVLVEALKRLTVGPGPPSGHGVRVQVLNPGAVRRRDAVGAQAPDTNDKGVDV